MKSKQSINRRFVYLRILVFASLFICALSGNSIAQEFKSIRPGVEYARVDYKIGGDPVKINLLRMDLTKVRLDVHHALDAAIGVEPTSSIANRHHGVAAINAGFFRLDNSMFAGDSVGILMIDRSLFSEPRQNRIAIFIDNRPDQTIVAFDHLETSHWFEIKKRLLTVDGTNRERKENELITYTSVFHPTTLTLPSGIEVSIVDNRVREIRDGSGSMEIPMGGYVLSASGKRREEVLAWIRKGWLRVGNRVNGYTSVTPSSATSKDVPYGSEDITNGVPQLIKDGKVDITWEQEKASKSFAEMRHPRTAAAKLRDGKFLMITVDGRQPGVSVGMNLQELTEYLLSVGATDAMNLDGGGSTTMFLDGKVVNTPSGQRRREKS